MDWKGEIRIDRVAPTEADVLRALGVPAGHEPKPEVWRAVASGIEELRRIATPRGIAADVAIDQFARIYEGDGDNETPSPLAAVFPRAEGLTLFAVTVGGNVSDRIADLFASGEYATGGSLDAAASEAAELAAEHMTRTVLAGFRHAGRAARETRALRYSPGYCGWSLTGQRALFEALAPGAIGITLGESCLMDPVKSISGVVVVGPARIHEFPDDYGFCRECETHECRERIAKLSEE